MNRAPLLEDVYLYILNRAILTRLAQSVERQPFKLVAVGSSPTSGGGKRQSLGLEPEVSRKWRYQANYESCQYF